ncbi:hypothetical protein ACFXKR_39580 [Streptomyces violascens]|uniref:hypothetical protein n=1 Tax=Streptomyces violascens TaxID=67381 RepID=UPI0036C52B3D
MTLRPYGSPLDPDGAEEAARWEEAARLLARLHRIQPAALPGLLARPAAWFAAGLPASDTWAGFLAAYREGGGPTVPVEGDIWPQLYVSERALTVQTGAPALAECAEQSRPPDEAERAMPESCTRIAAVQGELGQSPT